jgi:hypothetical protein
VSEDKPRIAGTVPIGGILLLFIGIVLLLQTTNVLPCDLWVTLWKFWPVIIIIFGLGILLHRFNVWLISLLTLVILGVCLGIAVWQSSPTLGGDLRVGGENYSVPIETEGIERIEAKIEFSVGNINIGKLASGSFSLFEAGATLDGEKYLQTKQEKPVTMIYNFSQTGLTGNLSLKPTSQEFWNKWDVAWRVDFNPKVPLSLDMKCDAADLFLDLTQLKITMLLIEMNASNGELMLPVPAGDSMVKIDMDVSNLEITVPEGVAVKIQADANLSIFEIDERRFPKQGDYYVSPNYDSATNSIELKIICDVGRITIK